MTLFLIVAALLALAALYGFGDQPSCVMCGGHGAHRKDCPQKKHDE